MAKDKSNKSVKKSKSGVSKKEKKAARIAEKKAQKAARKGDGAFPDVIVVTKEKRKDDGTPWLLGHDGEKMDTLYEDGQTVAVYKLRKVSKVSIKRKVER